MKQVLLLCVLFALGGFGTTRVRGAADPGERFLEAYFQIQDGDAAERAGDWAKANTKYNGALEILREIQTSSPEWNPHIIEFRTKYCDEHLESLKSKLGTAAPTPSEAAAPSVTAAPTPPPSAPAGEPDTARQLAAELQQARENIRQLQQTRDELTAKLEAKLKEPAPVDRTEAQQALEQLRGLQTVHAAVKAKLDEAVAKAAKADELAVQLQQSQERVRTLEAERTDLSSKLQAALAKTTSTQTNPQIEELMKKNVDLTAKLATAQSEIDVLRKGGEVAADTEKIQLRAQVTETRQQIEKVQTENVELKRSRDEIMARLTESDRQLRAVKASNEKSDQLIQQLRQENATLKEIAERKGLASRDEQADNTRTIPELKGARSRKRLPAAKQGAPTGVTESGTGRLVASIKAPPPASATTTVTRTSAPPAAAKAPPSAPRAVAKASPPTPPPARINTSPPKRATAPEPPPPAPPPPQPEVRTLLNEARAAFTLKDFNAASMKYEAVLAREPNNVTALSNIGVVRYQQGKLDEAEDALRKAVAQAPNDSPSRSLLGVVYFRKGKIEDAFGELTRAVALDPRNAEAHNYLGITLSEKGWQAAAEQEIRRAIELNPQYADAHFNLAVMYSRQKTPRLELSRYHYQKAIDLGADRDPQMEALLKGAEAPKADEPKKNEPKIESRTTTP